MRGAVIRALRSIRAPLFILSTVLVCLVYAVAAVIWSKTVGVGAWPPAWPVARTRLVLVMITTPIWAACMACCAVVSRFIGSRSPSRNYEGYELASREDYVNVAARPILDSGNLLDEQLETSGKIYPCPWIWWWRFRLSIYLLIVVFGIFLLCSYEQPNDIRYRPLLKAAMRSRRPEGFGNGEKIFIAAMFHNNAQIIPYWTEQIARVLHYIGTGNAYVSIIESYSQDATPELLLYFDKMLENMGVARRVIVRDTSIPLPDGMDARVKFLAASRNRALEPLVQRGGFDIILFSNDVLVSAESIVELLRTRVSEWDMVCGLDLSFWGLYDAWVTRDRLGHFVSSVWPYLIEETGREAVIAEDPAPVFTCWNGIVAIKADPFLPLELRHPGRLAATPFTEQLPKTHPAYPRTESQTPATTPPIYFRASANRECFSSESFNLPYDLRRQFNMTKIYINPRVIVGYDWSHYIWYKYITRHWLVKWWMQTWEKGTDLRSTRMIIGELKNVWEWDGGECQPW